MCHAHAGATPFLRHAQSFAPRENVYRSGDTADCMYVVQRGLFTQVASTKISVKMFRRGGYFGEVCHAHICRQSAHACSSHSICWATVRPAFCAQFCFSEETQCVRVTLWLRDRSSC